MDLPWPGYVAHVAEHFLALGRLHAQRFVQGLELAADAHGQRAQFQALQQVSFVALVLLSGWAGYAPCLQHHVAHMVHV